MAMMQIKQQTAVMSDCNSVDTNKANNKANNGNLNMIKSLGWFARSKSIIKYLAVVRDNLETQSHSHQFSGEGARCFECYEFVGFDDIAFSRIITNYNRNTDNRSGGKIPEGSGSGSGSMGDFEKHYNLSVLCKRCVSSLKQFKYAPKTYGDIVADLLINNKLDILAADLDIIGNKKLSGLKDTILKSVFNYNEKQLMLNHIAKENDNLKRNLDMEIEKHKILSEYKSKNRELQDSLKNHLLQSSIDLFRTHKKVIDEQIAKYSEYNNSSKYAVPECRICMLQEVSMALECGHLLCGKCHDHIKTENKAKLENENENENENDESLHVDGYPCPFCKTLSSKFIKIYL
jgi:hypothetical protein